MNLSTESYQVQSRLWPASGQHVLAHFDADSIVVYQAYRPSIGRYAIEHGRFGGPDYSFSRMSWIKPNFLWMMYRCGWGTKEGQEVVLGLRIRRAFFDRVVAEAVPSSCPPDMAHDAWREAVGRSQVRRQWDPDHDPHGGNCERRAIQLGLRGGMLEALAGEELLEVIDMSPFVAAQRLLVEANRLDELQTPVERVYPGPG